MRKYINVINMIMRNAGIHFVILSDGSSKNDFLIHSTYLKEKILISS